MQLEKSIKIVENYDFKQKISLTHHKTTTVEKMDFNPFSTNVPLLYPLKTSENCKVFRCFHGVEKGCIGNEWVKRKNHRGENKMFLFYERLI